MDDVIRRELHALHKARCPPTSQKWSMDRDSPWVTESYFEVVPIANYDLFIATSLCA
jgi:hypothetical protein